MIANVVTGRVDLDADEGAIRERLIPALRQAGGYQGGYWLRQPAGDEVLAVTLWESEEALRAALGSPAIREATAHTSSLFVEGPRVAAYRLIAQG
jgi:heme-degrading monooxygenase HmoA